MQRRFTVMLGVALSMGLGVACSPDQEHPVSADEDAQEEMLAADPVIDHSGLWTDVEAQVTAHVDSVDRALRRVPNLTGREQGVMRQDVNAVQVATARRLGVRAGDDFERHAEAGRLVRLADSTRYWIVRELTYSVPYVTPDTEAMLAELGERFHARLDSLGLPRFRMEITSVLRTAANQRALQRTNPNAARGVSSHEFATTVDVAYRHFAPPLGGAGNASADAPGNLETPADLLYEALMVETARNRGTELQAILGRVILEMRREGKLQVIMERQQTVYHMTVAQRFPNREPVPAE
jgi:hypothetical protein